MQLLSTPDVACLTVILRQSFPDLTFYPQGKYAIRFYLKSRMHDLETQIEMLVSGVNWTLSSRGTDRHPGECVIECNSTNQVSGLDIVFHASKRDIRDLVSHQGLRVSPVARTFTRRKYPSPRIHFARSLAGIVAFIRSAIRAQSRPVTRQAVQQLIQVYDIWRVSAVDLPLFVDPLMETEGVWTETDVESRRLRRERFVSAKVCTLLMLSEAKFISI